MPKYVKRDGEGKVSVTANWPIKGLKEERLADDHPDILEFHARQDAPAPPMSEKTDAEVIAFFDSIGITANALDTFLKTATPKP